jgi:hypothetical protein
MPNYLDGTLKHTRRLIGIHVRGHKGKQASCVGKKLDGTKPGSREAARKALAKAAQECGK